MAASVYRVRDVALALAAARLGLAAAGLVAALALGAGGAPAGVALAFGACVTGAALVSDRRWVLTRRPSFEPLPDDAQPARRARAVATGLLPSTIGVAVLLVVSLPFEPVLAAVLAGVLAGMGLVGSLGIVELVLAERRDGVRVLADEHDTARRYVAPG